VGGGEGEGVIVIVVLRVDVSECEAGWERGDGHFIGRRGQGERMRGGFAGVLEGCGGG
jgi:hypothetical protein